MRFTDNLGHQIIQARKCEYAAHAFIRMMTHYSSKLSRLHTNWKSPINRGTSRKKILSTFAAYTSKIIDPTCTRSNS